MPVPLIRQNKAALINRDRFITKSKEGCHKEECFPNLQTKQTSKRNHIIYGCTKSVCGLFEVIVIARDHREIVHVNNNIFLFGDNTSVTSQRSVTPFALEKISIFIASDI